MMAKNMTVSLDQDAMDAITVAEIKRLTSLCDMAWVIMANASGGDWDKESDEWRTAASEWGDKFFGWRKVDRGDARWGK
jgi:hypothetical protein